MRTAEERLGYSHDAAVWRRLPSLYGESKRDRASWGHEALGGGGNATSAQGHGTARDGRPYFGASCSSTSTGGGEKSVKKSLAAEQAEMLKLIEHLEEVAVGLQGDNAGVSQKDIEDLERIRLRVAMPQGPEERRQLVGLAMEFLTRLAAELLLKVLSGHL